MTAPPLKPYTEETAYGMDKIKRGEVEIDYLIQAMVWDPKATSLQPIIQQGILIPSDIAIQGQIQFIFQKEYAISIRYSRDANSFGLKVSRDAKKWLQDSISGNEKQALEIFKENFMKMMDSIQTGGLS